MTNEEKKRKAYVNAVERRLNLPREIKVRVMTDFITTVSTLREAGKTDEEIYAQLGTPKEAARVLNEQMKEFAYRKSPWRFRCLVGAVLFLLMLLLFLLPPLLWNPAAGAVSIIGGADGPTAIFVTSFPATWTDYLVCGVLFLLCLFGYRKLCRCDPKKK